MVLRTLHEVYVKIIRCVQKIAFCMDEREGVGPNITDEYWIHGGSIKDVFKSIKYGWQDKGMQPWKDFYKPIQIAQLTSFIKSLKGTNPPGAKEKQGELYVEEVVASMSTSDSTKTK